MRRTVNHVVTRTVHEDIVMPNTLENCRSRYRVEYDAESYAWTVTDQWIRNTATRLAGFGTNYENVHDPYPRATDLLGKTLKRRHGTCPQGGYIR